MTSAPESQENEAAEGDDEKATRPSLATIATVFLRLGSTAFGGPAAHLALMEEELVRKRNWLSRQDFLDMLGAASLIPGPNSTEMAIHVGYKMGGLPGLVIAGICFISPAFLMVSALSWLYLKFDKLPMVTAILYGLKPVIIAIVFQALWLLAKTSLKTLPLNITALFVALLFLLGANELALLFGCGLVAAIFHFAKSPQPREIRVLTILAAACTSILGGTYLLSAYSLEAVSYSPAVLFLYFLKLGSVLYGSGYVLLAFLRTDLVESYHWISSAQLLDAVAVGQITPGPLFTTATFIGFILGGPTGAAVATIGIFLPAFFLVAFTAPLIKRMRASILAGHFLDAVNAASIALMAGVLLQLGRAALVDLPTVIIAASSAIFLIRFKVNSLWLMLGGAIAGFIFAQGRH
ncbi:chromate efflux transporter [bacterium]|nr:chromate efflux transporter [bacterium]MBP9808997.1 chromate efflux transporter [bacterium]